MTINGVTCYYLASKIHHIFRSHNVKVSENSIVSRFVFIIFPVRFTCFVAIVDVISCYRRYFGPVAAECYECIYPCFVRPRPCQPSPDSIRSDEDGRYGAASHCASLSQSPLDHSRHCTRVASMERLRRAQPF